MRAIYGMSHRQEGLEVLLTAVTNPKVFNHFVISSIVEIYFANKQQHESCLLRFQMMYKILGEPSCFLRELPKGRISGVLER